MIPHAHVESLLCRLAAASEELVRMLERRDPRYLEALEQREELLEELARLLPSCPASPLVRSALERVRQIGNSCTRQARALRQETVQALAALDRELAYAESLQRLAGGPQSRLLDFRG